MLGRDNHVDIRSVSYEVRVTSKICIIFEIIQSRQSRFLKLCFLIHSNLKKSLPQIYLYVEILKT